MGEEGRHNTKNTTTCKNDEEEDDNGTSTTAAATAMSRIFVGGLGGTVTVEDLRRTFSSLGNVDSVEIVRTKGRSFAYFDFLPSSHKSLSKLFSTYNGCSWKGGKLRLEKAKEHHLLRLRREWAEDARLANGVLSNAVDATKNMGSPKKLNNVLNPEKMEVQLFFPKFKKVKSLPFSGTGKHKYSFQRIQVPPLPNHFCDCEEHYVPPEIAKEKEFSDLETQGGGIDEKELNMMKSVMNKLFEKENILKATYMGAGLVKAGDTESVDDLLVDESETDHLTDEDNLVTNMVAGGKNRTALLGSQGQETILDNEGAIVSELRTSRDRLSGNVLKSLGRKIVPSDKKRKSPLTEEIGGNEVVSASPNSKGSAKRTHFHESAQAMELESGIRQSNSNLSCSQKSAWRDLAGERGSTSFRISHLMQSTAPTKEESKSDGVNIPYFTDDQNQNLGENLNMEFQSGLSKEPKELAVTQLNIPNAALNKSARGASWLQKSSWTQLVGETNSSFSICQVLPGMNSEKQEQKSLDATNSTVSNFCKLVNSCSSKSFGDGSIASGVGNEGILTAPDRSNTVALATGLDTEQHLSQKNLQTSGETDEITTAPKKNHAAPAQPSIRSFTIGETCSFMRSASSMREWMTIKAALGGSLKKRRKKEN